MKPGPDELCDQCRKPAGRTKLFEFTLIEWGLGGRLHSRNEFMHMRCVIKYLRADPTHLVGVPSDG